MQASPFRLSETTIRQSTQCVDVLSPSPDAVRPPADRRVAPPASEKRALVRHWGVAVAVALLLHGFIAVIVVLAWRKLPTLNPRAR